MLIENSPVITEEEVEQALRFATEQVLRNLPEFTYQFQKAYSEDNFYQPVENNDWTTGFWTGEIWLAYEYSKDERSMKLHRIACLHFTSMDMCTYVEYVKNIRYLIQRLPQSGFLIRVSG